MARGAVRRKRVESARKGKRMKISWRPVAAIQFAVCLLVATGCSRDVNAQKQKYFESGNRFQEQGKYAEAVIQYQNAIQKDGKFTAAHYQLAKCYVQQNL